ncbi:hypothetical protein B7P34_04675 [Streptosporangium nondiastaticum]|uniref:Cell surface glycoprotein n=1 Tax=Streptosporangium nondiastaticum TaxID=35764 RepID=A0A9X7JTW8_9ACTN|nr:hypothetical protein [Streptosporangium nondiastaticum]PSJ29809.1 hypothetical protein B7P34_04675 [Streptosporangium nondiastaticum]
MTPADAAELLALAAAFDRRTIGEADAHAWARALRDIPLDRDTRTAVAEHYARTEQWITPARVREVRARIRETRIGDAHPVYDGTPGETGAQFVERRRAQITAAADGTLPARTITQAIGAGPRRDVLALAAAVGHAVDAPERPYIPTAIVEQLAEQGFGARRKAFPELTVECPLHTCRARKGSPCKAPSGRELREHTHDLRQRAYTEHVSHVMSQPPAPRTTRARHTAGGRR